MAFKAPPPDEQDPADQAAAPEQASPPESSGGMGAEPDQAEGEAPAEGAQQGQKATPEQQAQYEKFVNQGYHLLYTGGKVQPAILKSLGTGNPIKALATTAVEVVMRLILSAKEQGVPLDAAVELHGGLALYQELAGLSAKAKIHTYTQTEIDTGWVLAMGMAQQKLKAAGLLDPAAFKQEADEINRAQQDGTLDHDFPALGEVVNKIGPDVEKAMQQRGAAPPGGAPPAANDQQMPQAAGGSGGLM